MAFTEQDVAMLSSVFKSERAIQVNTQIIRTFSKIRQMIDENTELRKEFEDLKSSSDKDFRIIFQSLDQLIKTKEIPTRKIGFQSKKN